jgi:FlaA1/EpsC-like NDP-sugar epimerase
MTEREKVFVYGASGHAKVVIDAIEREGSRDIAWIFDDAIDKHGKQLMGYDIVGGREAERAWSRSAKIPSA